MNERNQSVDILRGLAILMVILGHTVSGCVEGYAESFVYNVIWSLQMPLFFLLSGYVNRYRKVVCDGEMLVRSMLRRTATYFIPWLVWTVLVRGLVFGESMFLKMEYLLWHMDSGYWFLTSLWMITLTFGISQFTASKVVNVEHLVKHLITTMVCFAVCALVYLAVGFVVGLSFLGIKLTVYYMPFYALGVLFGVLQDLVPEEKLTFITELFVPASCFIYFALITRFDLFLMGESIPEIGIRVLSSLTGCAALCGLLAKCFARGLILRGLNWAGIHSLELYLVHYLLLCKVNPIVRPTASSLEGLGLCALNYLITVALSAGFVWLLHQNRALRKVLFWK